jgi:hypothetical protein
MAEQINADDHLHNCDLVRRSRQGYSDGECYCPTPAEAAEMAGYQKRISDGIDDDPMWVRSTDG